MTLASPSIENIKGSDGTNESVRAVVNEQRAVSSTIIKVNSLVGFNSSIIGTTGALDADDKLTVRPQVFFGHISGSDIEIDSFAPGYTDAGNEVGDIVVIKPTTSWADEIGSLLEVSLNDDGTLKDNSVVEDNLTAGIVTTKKQTAITYTGVMDAIASVTTNWQDAKSITLPAVSQAHKYLLIGSFEFNCAGNAHEFTASIRIDGSIGSQGYWGAIATNYYNTITCNTILTSSATGGQVITFSVAQTTGSGGGLTARSRYSIVDLGCA